MPTQVSLLDGALASAGTLAIQTNGTTSAITISSAQVATFVNNPIMTGLTASRAVFTDGSKGLTSNAITGTGNVVMSASPTLTGTIDGAALTLSSSLTLSGGTANGVLYLNGSKVATSGSALTFDGKDLGVGNSRVSFGANISGITLDNTGANQNIVWRVNSVTQASAFTNGTSGFIFGTETNVPLQFQINGSEQMRLTSAGLGIGTSSPIGVLDVASSSNPAVRIRNTSTGGAGIWFGNSTSGTTTSDGSNVGIDSSQQLNLWNYENTATLFATNNTERARIDSSGNLLLGVTAQLNSEKQYIYQSANGIGLQINCVNATQTDYCFRIRAARNTTNGTFNAIAYYNDGAGAYKFNVADSGNVTNTNNSYGAISDIKLKENITDATPKLADLMQVKVRNYNLKSDPEHKQLGVIAQELEQVFPGMVEESPDRDAEGNDLGTTTKQVKYSVFVPMLIKAMQEQQAIIVEMKAEIDALKAKVGA